MNRKPELDLLRILASHLAENYDRLPNVNITGFMAMKGDLFSQELMVIGRAVNGWTQPWLPKDLKNVDDVTKFVDGVLKSVTDSDCCPMRWVTDCWGKHDKDYNTRKSAFWRSIRNTVGRLGVADIESPEWASYLVWSNIYKIAPAAGGNPSSTLCSAQLDLCKRILKQELQTFRPRRVLFLTGLGWSQPFTEHIGCELSKNNSGHYVEATGKVTIGTDIQAKVVIAVHPQGKNEKNWVEEVIQGYVRH